MEANTGTQKIFRQSSCRCRGYRELALQPNKICLLISTRRCYDWDVKIGRNECLLNENSERKLRSKLDERALRALDINKDGCIWQHTTLSTTSLSTALSNPQEKQRIWTFIEQSLRSSTSRHWLTHHNWDCGQNISSGEPLISNSYQNTESDIRSSSTC